MLPGGHLGIMARGSLEALQGLIEGRTRLYCIISDICWRGGERIVVAIASATGGCCGNRVVGAGAVVYRVIDLCIVGGLRVVWAGRVHLSIC